MDNKNVKKEVSIRIATETDYLFLKKMLYESLYVSPGKKKYKKSILETPDVKRFIDNWNHKKGDYGLILMLNGTKIGAAWVRLFTKIELGSVFIDENTPEFAIALETEYRNQGLGTFLLKKLISDLKTDFNYKKVSLSVSIENPAYRLYKRLGFTKIGVKGNSHILVLNL